MWVCLQVHKRWGWCASFGGVVQSQWEEGLFFSPHLQCMYVLNIYDGGAEEWRMTRLKEWRRQRKQERRKEVIQGRVEGSKWDWGEANERRSKPKEKTKNRLKTGCKQSCDKECTQKWKYTSWYMMCVSLAAANDYFHSIQVTDFMCKMSNKCLSQVPNAKNAVFQLPNSSHQHLKHPKVFSNLVSVVLVQQMFNTFNV